MRLMMACVMILAAALAQAQDNTQIAGDMDDGPVNPAGPRDADGIDTTLPAADQAWLRAQLQRIGAESRMEPTICADLSATPTPLPNGDMQFPVVPCKGLDVTTGPAPVAPQQPSVQQPVLAPQARPVQTGTPVAGQPLMVAPNMTADDLNMLQMKRLGQLDAMQGRPINMNNANNLGYLQGYTEGQQRRVQGPGGFGGYNR